MFYSQIILARKGPLGKIWLAAHYDKKLNKAQIFTTDIVDSVRCVLEPSAPLALRVSGHLMLGIVRIYSRKVKYLMADCAEAMWKMKLAFKAGMVDLSEAQAVSYGIDDLRYFGTVVLDQAFPDLENVSFPVRFEEEAEEAPMLTYGERPEEAMEEDLWQRGAVVSTPRSEVEMARAERTSLVSSTRSRTSLANIQSFQQGADISRLSIAYEEEIPAFAEHEDFMMAGEPAPHLFMPGEEAEMMAYEPVMEEEGLGYEETKEYMPEEEEEIVPEVEERRKAKKKRKVAIVDQNVELSNRVIKETMRDRSALLRRHPTDPLPITSREGPGSKPSSISLIQGLCPELEELFETSLRPIPKPSIRESRLEEPEAPRRQSVASSAREQRIQQEGSPNYGEFAEQYEVEQEPIFQYEETYVPEGEAPYFTPPRVLAEDFGEAAEKGPEEAPKIYSPIRANTSDWNQRTRHVFEIIDDQLQRHETISFQELSAGVSKRTAATCFLEMLQLKTWDVIEIQQEEAFGEIQISRAD